MANSSLEGKTYQLPVNVIQFLKSKASVGGKRIQGLINNPNATYEQLKRFKHDIENGLSGDWSTVLNWINSVLGNDRGVVDNQKRTTMETGMENRFRKTHEKDYNSNLTPLSEDNKIMKIKITEDQYRIIEQEIINESENFGQYRTKALRDLLKQKNDLISKTRQEIKEITDILNKRKRTSKIDPEPTEPVELNQEIVEDDNYITELIKHQIKQIKENKKENE